MKRALVLSGGGSRGAYEIGVWKALRELNVRLDSVYGTSIGALNAALVARGDLDAAQRLWQNISIRQVLTVEDDEEDFAIDSLAANKRDVIPFLVENAKHLRMDVTPLVNLVKAECSEARIRASGMELGIMTCRIPQLQGVPMRLRDVKPGTLGDWIVASASCYPLFPSKTIDGKRYIDGGYFDNQPIDMALKDDADEIIAVGLRPEPVHPEYERMPWLISIRPRHTLGGFLDFNPNLLTRGMRLGYQDAMKRYRKLEGFLFTFTRTDQLAATAQARRFINRVTDFDAEFMRRGLINMGRPVNAPLMMQIESETDYRMLDWKGVWLRGLESCMSVMQCREDAIYDPDTMIGRFRAFCDAQDVDAELNEKTLHAAWKAGDRQVFALLTHYLDTHDDFPRDVLHRLGELPLPTTAAMFMRAVK